MGRRGKVRVGLGIVGALCVGCVPSRQPERSPSYSETRPSEPRPGAAPSPGEAGPAPATPPATKPHVAKRPSSPNISGSTAAAPPNARKAPCGESACVFFPDNLSAAEYLRNNYAADILAFGEAHAPEGLAVRSTALRFADSMLPVFAPKASFLLVELLAPPTGCDAARAEVQEKSDQVTVGQAETNQADYFTLGHKARSLGVSPDVLRATCEDMKAIAAGGDDGVLAMMSTIARLSGKELLERSRAAPPRRKLVLAYGGALHNDVRPSAPYESWSYGPLLEQATSARYLEVDLLLPEGFTSSAWSRMEWFQVAVAAYDDKRPEEAVLIERSPSSVALILAEEAPRVSEETPQDLEK